jgi:DNA/RNA-binding domain of Phe-tRNA-synthetase-like protein
MDPSELPTLEVHLDAGIASKIRIASFLLEPVRAGDRPAGLEQAITALGAKYGSLWPEPADAQEALRPARRLYHSLGIDPSKLRPSSEALLRRILQGKGLYTVNAVVDAANLASLTVLLPVGLYDADRLQPPLTLRFGREGEEYAGIRKEAIHLAGRPVLVDAIGPFGNPSSDSLRTSVTEGTRRIWFVLFAPPDYPSGTLRKDLLRCAEILRQHAV